MIDRIDRAKAFPKTEQQICAESVMCPKCRGALYRMQDGEGRLSEMSGRMVLKCDRCQQRWSVPVPTDEVRRPRR